MKNKLFILFFVILTFSKVFAQNKYDYQWISGFTYRPFRGNIIDFNNKGKIDTLIIGLPIEGNSSSICDKTGKLLFYFNGCKVANYEHELIENGDSLNYGETWEKFCAGGYQGYPGSQNSIILPDPGSEKGYYLIHKRLEIKLEPKIQSYSPELYYSYINMEGNNGKGMVIKKNEVIFKTTSFLPTYLTACKHSNGGDWWIIGQELDTNIYFKVLLTKDSIMVVDSQSMGPILTDYTAGYGQAVFTPDGNKYLLYTEDIGALIYDFDRKTGELSNFQRVETQDSGRFVGIAVSPNSRYAYLSSTFDLYQIDLWSDDIQSTLTHIDHVDGFRDPSFVSLFGQAQLAPDCKIYIVSSTTNNHLHVINNPNEKGKACNFRQHSVYLPNRNYNNSLPNFPHFRIDEEDICDSTITWIPDEYIVKAPNALSVYPNPTSVSATISVYSDGYEYGKIRIFDINGEMIRSMDIDSDKTLSLDVEEYTPGVYVVEYVSFVSGGRDVRKLVVVE